MGNPYFQFKQFTVFHDLCAMKVGIDGVLIGAWAEVENSEKVLDIGTGSGLIALMLAQRNPKAEIIAIDIEEGAVRQAEINMQASPWKDSIYLQQIGLQDFAERQTKKYDLIVSNPPFFVNSLKTPVRERTHARHTDSLTHEDLITCSQKLLASEGKLCLILPVEEGEHSISFAEKAELYCSKKVKVYPKPGVAAKRLLLEFRSEKGDTEISELTIETEKRHQYSPEFIRLAKEFYLKL